MRCAYDGACDSQSRAGCGAVLDAFWFWLGWAQAQSGVKAERKTLEQAQDASGIPCAKGYAWFYADGKLQRCTTSREIAFGEAKVPAGSIVVLLADGKPDYAMMVRKGCGSGHPTLTVASRGNRVLGPSEGR